jgi:outer membrane protein insertion porin family
MGLEMDNLMGTGKRLALNFNNDDANQVYSVSFTDPYYTVDGISRSINVSYRKRDASEEDINNFLTNTYGANVIYGVPLTEYDRIRLGIGFENTDIIRAASSATSNDVLVFLNSYGEGSVDSDGNYTEASIQAATLVASYTHDTRNRTVFATEGSSQSVILDMTAPGSDLEYYKLTYRTKFYFDVTNDLTLLLKSDIAYGDGYGDNEDLPFYERFYAGGLRTVRGFDSNSLGPRDETTNDPRGGDLRTVAGAELIFPVPFMDKSPRSVRLSAFYDVGNVFLRDEGGFDEGELRSSVGVSFVWLAPIGPLRFSWAKPVEKKAGDETQVFQFSIGSFF